ncbi:MAG: fused MFS/spermidine synthase, partial [Planctomycetota bacterium]
AHAATTWLGVRRQAVLHLAVVLLALAVQPIVVRQIGPPPSGTTPVFWLLGVLAVSVGGPFFVVTASSPLLQKWFTHTDHPERHDPYFLYAASNLGSMLALLGYPVLIEPLLRLQGQSRLWTSGYAVMALLTLACAAVVWRRRHEPDRSPPARAGRARRAGSSRRGQPPALTARRRCLWTFFSFVPSSCMLGVTAYLTTDVAPVPMLWVIPLAMYLLTFILAFARRSPVPRAVPIRLFPYAALLLVASLIFHGPRQEILLHLAVFFVAALTFHGALAQDRPASVHLTEFYLWIAVGGMLGGVFNALVAPLAFPWGLEYPLTMLAACLLYPAALHAQRLGPPDRWLNIASLAGVVLLVALFTQTMKPSQSTTPALMVLCGAPLLVLLHLANAHRLFALGIAVLLVAEQLDPPYVGEVLYTTRSFYGVHRVMRVTDDHEAKYHRLVHGRTIHGVQSRDPNRRREPLGYYHRAGPLGQVFGVFQGRDAKRRVAIVGLGVGTMICYREPGQKFTFYEIDPTVKRIAETTRLFSYLSDCGPAGYSIVLGDGRLRLAEAPDHHYGMIIFDAFSSDAIPTHLLTRQALAMYLEKLADDGILVFHISNKSLDLEPVLANLAAAARLLGYIRRDDYLSELERKAGKFTSTYVVLARRNSHLKGLTGLPQWKPLSAASPEAVWTDDFSNVLQVIRWW